MSDRRPRSDRETSFRPGWLQAQVAKSVAAIDSLPLSLRKSLTPLRSGVGRPRKAEPMMTTANLPTTEHLDAIEAHPVPDAVATLAGWCRNLLADREEAVRWAEISRRDRESMSDRIRAVADLCDRHSDTTWADEVRATLRGER